MSQIALSGLSGVSMVDMANAIADFRQKQGTRWKYVLKMLWITCDSSLSPILIRMRNTFTTGVLNKITYTMSKEDIVKLLKRNL